MHKFKTSHTRFHYNPDLSGRVYILDLETGKGLDVHGEDLLHPVALWVRTERLQRLADVEWRETLLGDGHIRSE